MVVPWAGDGAMIQNLKLWNVLKGALHRHKDHEEETSDTILYKFTGCSWLLSKNTGKANPPSVNSHINQKTTEINWDIIFKEVTKLQLPSLRNGLLLQTTRITIQKKIMFQLMHSPIYNFNNELFLKGTHTYLYWRYNQWLQRSTPVPYSTESRCKKH